RSGHAPPRRLPRGWADRAGPAASRILFSKLRSFWCLRCWSFVGRNHLPYVCIAQIYCTAAITKMATLSRVERLKTLCRRLRPTIRHWKLLESPGSAAGAATARPKARYKFRFGGGAVAGGGAAAGGGDAAGWLFAAESPPNSRPPAEIALPGRSITQLTVLPVAFAAVPANIESDENTLAAKLRGWGSGSAASVAVVTVTGGSKAGSTVTSGADGDCADAVA